jgi:hypothetical protein
MDAAAIINALGANLAQPKRARTDAGEIEQHDLATQLAMAKFLLAQNSVSRSPFRALRFAQVIASNATGGSDPVAVAAVYPPPGMAGLPGYDIG